MESKSMQPAVVFVTGVVCASIVILSSVFSYFWFNINDRRLMSANIDTAISKGVDPMTVRCSYAPSTDNICVAYAISQNNNHVAPAAPLTRSK